MYVVPRKHALIFFRKHFVKFGSRRFIISKKDHEYSINIFSKRVKSLVRKREKYIQIKILNPLEACDTLIDPLSNVSNEGTFLQEQYM